jgi:hypothetical protein
LSFKISFRINVNDLSLLHKTPLIWGDETRNEGFDSFGNYLRNYLIGNIAKRNRSKFVKGGRVNLFWDQSKEGRIYVAPMLPPILVDFCTYLTILVRSYLIIFQQIL